MANQCQTMDHKKLNPFAILYCLKGWYVLHDRQVLDLWWQMVHKTLWYKNNKMIVHCCCIFMSVKDSPLKDQPLTCSYHTLRKRLFIISAITAGTLINKDDHQFWNTDLSNVHQFENIVTLIKGCTLVWVWSWTCPASISRLITSDIFGVSLMI